ncbi:hypothetical protein OU994_00270 [Pseudoduganella sp. SL102]|uniref:hypothetical protein n=1 Tax=Pseudoduganella sp. SL102 TaxID=2995154 RepID=UPI00248B9E25|nr:hypothetical protein [Pseudoduganella sp. SL102]WBS02776.1 hypothetical protein OU994_00270 [Pseudoduganella sp. SL102]
MDHVVIVLSSQDIPGVITTATRLGPGCRVACFDPSVLDELKAAGLPQAEYVDFPGAPTFPDLHNGSREEALAIEADLFGLFGPVLPGVRSFAWLHLNWYYLLIALRWYSALGEYIAAHYAGLFGSRKAMVLLNDNPANFFWPSFVPALCVLEALSRAGVALEAFSYEPRPDETGALPALLAGDDRSERWDLLTHLPTCMHDVPMLEEELKASGRRIINIRAKYWDTPVPAAHDVGLGHKHDLLRIVPENVRNTLNLLLPHVQARIDAVLAPHIRVDAYRERQAKQLTSLYETQLLTYLLLHDFFAGRKPRKMLLCDHDAGFHGPLIAYADAEGIPVLFFPHSKTIADIQFSADNVACLVHPVQGASLNDGAGRRVAHHKLAFPETLSAFTVLPHGLRTVGLLLNSITLNGVMVGGWQPFMDGIRLVANWCRRHGVALEVRSRPGHSIYEMVAEATGIPADTLAANMRKPLSQFAAEIDLCLMYDAPTTAELEFLRRNVPILNPIPEALAKYEAVIACTDIIPRGAVEEILFRMEGFASDPANLHAFKLQQFAAYAGAFRDAAPLRAYL